MGGGPISTPSPQTMPSIIQNPKFEIHSISVLEPFDPKEWATTFLKISLTSINPNKDREIMYDNIVVSVFYDKEILFVGILRPFHHESGETKLVEETVHASIRYEEMSAVVGGGNFSVKIDARMKYAPGTCWERIEPVTARCENVSVEFPPPRSDPEVVTTVTEKLSDDQEFEAVLADVLVELEDVLVYVLAVLVTCCLCLLGFFYLGFLFITSARVGIVFWMIQMCFVFKIVKHFWTFQNKMRHLRSRFKKRPSLITNLRS